MQRQRCPVSINARRFHSPASRKSGRAGVVALALGAALLAVTPAAAAPETVKLDAGGDAIDLHTGRGMSAGNPQIKALLDAHPNDFVVICVAGCDGKPKAVQILPRPVAGRTGEYVPTAAPIGQGSSKSTSKGTYGPPRPGTAPPRQMADESNDVICLAGCMGKPGSIVQRMKDLPPINAHAGGAGNPKGAKIPAAKQ